MLNRSDSERRVPARRGGFTVLELLVATAALSLVLVYSLGTFTANRNTYAVIENVSEAHQNTLAIASLVERDIRSAGYKVPATAAACGVDSTTGPDMLFLSDVDAIVTVESLPTEIAGDDLAATGDFTTSWNPDQEITLDDVVIDQQPTYDTEAPPGADSDFRINSGVIFSNPDDETDGVYCGIVTDVDASNDKITVDLSSPSPTGAGTGWSFVPANVYTLVNGALLRNGVVIARNVEDFQLAWFYDLDDDGQKDPNQDFGSGSSEPDLDASALTNPALLREIRMNLVVTTADDDPNNPTSAGTGQPTENRTNAPGPDGRRRRVYTSTTRLRNLSS